MVYVGCQIALLVLAGTYSSTIRKMCTFVLFTGGIVREPGNSYNVYHTRYPYLVPVPGMVYVV